MTFQKEHDMPRYLGQLVTLVIFGISPALIGLALIGEEAALC